MSLDKPAFKVCALLLEEEATYYSMDEHRLRIRVYPGSYEVTSMNKVGHLTVYGIRNERFTF